MSFSGYVFGGIVALAAARFATVHRRWHGAEAEIDASLGAHWLRQVTTQLVFTTVSCALLVGAWLGGLLILPARFLGSFGLLIVRGVAWVLALFAIGESPGRMRLIRHIITAQWVTVAPGSSGVDAWWLCLLVLAIVVIGTSAVVARSRWIRWVLRMLRSQRVLLDRAASAASEHAAGQRMARWRRLLPGHLTPRERILRDFGRLLRHTARHGLPRATGMTARDFTSLLGPVLPGVADDLETLTMEFSHARYSRHDVDASVADRVHRCWTVVWDALVRYSADTSASVEGG